MNIWIIGMTLVMALLLAVTFNHAYGLNEVEQIIIVNGTITAGQATYDHDFSALGSITNFDKSIIYMSFAHIGDSEQDRAYRSWNLTNSTNLRFYASDDTPGDNISLDFAGCIIEYTATSDLTVQDRVFSVAGGGGPPQQEFTDTFSSVNTTRSNFIFSGQDHDGTEDLGWGMEEFARMRIIDSTTFGYEIFDRPNTGPTNVRYQIIDWGDNNVEVQRGLFLMPEGNSSVTFSPPNPIQHNRTMIFMSHELDGTEDAEFDEHSYHATIDTSNNVVIEREDAVCGAGEGDCDIYIGWETIEFKDDSIFVSHNLVVDNISTGSNVQQVIIDEMDTPLSSTEFSMAIGTVHTPLGLGQASSDSGSRGAWDRGAFTIELVNTTHTRLVFNDGQEPTVLGYQAIEFNALVVAQPDFIFIPISCCFFFNLPDLLGLIMGGSVIFGAIFSFNKLYILPKGEKKCQ